MSSADDTDAVTAFRPLMTDAHTEQQPRRTSTTGATTNHQMHGSPAAASPHFQIQEPHWALTPLQVLPNLAVSIGGELGTWAPPVDNLRDRTHRDAWTDYHGVLESLSVGVTHFDDRFQDPDCDYDEAMGSTFTAGVVTAMDFVVMTTKFVVTAMECVVMIVMCTATPLVMLSTDGESSVTMLRTSAMTNMKCLSAKVTASRMTMNTMKLSKMTKGTLMTPRQ
ncbi:hypothetical protein PF004_g30624 [Phytophthora fragariae]|uniref:Uncharacterized protein n=2 Tax=Phytophthora fragariae TaxID=53985 RepID=A0A6G0MD37_9STRA|nr:hypothetical protein PF004_g30624 [Phytophthora fragariae]